MEDDCIYNLLDLLIIIRGLLLCQNNHYAYLILSTARTLFNIFVEKSPRCFDGMENQALLFFAQDSAKYSCNFRVSDDIRLYEAENAKSLPGRRLSSRNC